LSPSSTAGDENSEACFMRRKGVVEGCSIDFEKCLRCIHVVEENCVKHWVADIVFRSGRRNSKDILPLNFRSFEVAGDSRRATTFVFSSALIVFPGKRASGFFGVAFGMFIWLTPVFGVGWGRGRSLRLASSLGIDAVERSHTPHSLEVLPVKPMSFGPVQ